MGRKFQVGQKLLLINPPLPSLRTVIPSFRFYLPLRSISTQQPQPTQLFFSELQSFRLQFTPRTPILNSSPGKITIMAMFSSSKRNSNSSNFGNHQSISRSSSSSPAPKSSPVLASCYATLGSSTVVQGFHYCSTGANG